MGRRFLGSLLVIIVLVTETEEAADIQQVHQLVSQWAPLIWLAPNEKFFPSDVELFLTNVKVANKAGHVLSTFDGANFRRHVDTKSLFLVTDHEPNKYLLGKNKSFLHGQSPKNHPVPIYAVVTLCTPQISARASTLDSWNNDINKFSEKLDSALSFHVDYWNFYPYNEGKEVCFIIGTIPTPKIFGRCLGRFKTMGAHVGDWERVSLFFDGNSYPSEMFVAVHDAGGYYTFNPETRHFKLKSVKKQLKTLQSPKLPGVVKMQNGHPILFAAQGSHGLWPAPGVHEYVRVPRLTDNCSYGIPWKTWHNIRVYVRGTDRLPDWMQFMGRWGNPRSKCFWFERLNWCENFHGPLGVLARDQIFRC